MLLLETHDFMSDVTRQVLYTMLLCSVADVFRQDLFDKYQYAFAKCVIFLGNSLSHCPRLLDASSLLLLQRERPSSFNTGDMVYVSRLDKQLGLGSYDREYYVSAGPAIITEGYAITPQPQQRCFGVA